MTNDGNPQVEALDAILGNAKEAMVMLDAAGQLINANSATAKLFGTSIEELLKANIDQLIPDLEFETTRKAHGFVGKEFQGRNSDGKTFPVHVTICEFSMGDESSEQLFAGIIRDMTGYTERQARLEAILDNAVDAIVTIDRRGLIDSINPATVTMFGFTETELIGENIKILMPQPYRDEHDGYLKNYLTSGTKKIIGIGREVIGRRKDGSTFPMHLAVSEIQVGDRQLFTGIIRDISDLKAAEKKLADMNEQLEERIKTRTIQLREAQADLVRSEKFATLGKVSGGIAHEIRNPLNAVKTSAYYLLNAKGHSNEKLREHLERIDRQVTLIDNVVTALSDVAKLPDADLKPVELEPVLRSVVSAVDLPVTIEVKFELPGDLPPVLVDETQIVIAFKNLVRNARDAMGEHGVLTFAADFNDETVSFHVTDDGSGISPEHLGQILEPLFTTKARGMGLGLSITLAIVEKNSGLLTVNSEAGKGSRFSIQLRRASSNS